VFVPNQRWCLSLKHESVSEGGRGESEADDDGEGRGRAGGGEGAVHYRG
jgi:hypothetical protein